MLWDMGVLFVINNGFWKMIGKQRSADKVIETILGWFLVCSICLPFILLVLSGIFYCFKQISNAEEVMMRRGWGIQYDTLTEKGWYPTKPYLKGNYVHFMFGFKEDFLYWTSPSVALIEADKWLKNKESQ